MSDPRTVGQRGLARRAWETLLWSRRLRSQSLSAVVVQDVDAPVVGVRARPTTPRARLSDPYEVEM